MYPWTRSRRCRDDYCGRLFVALGVRPCDSPLVGTGWAAAMFRSAPRRYDAGLSGYRRSGAGHTGQQVGPCHPRLRPARRSRRAGTTFQASARRQGHRFCKMAIEPAAVMPRNTVCRKSKAPLRSTEQPPSCSITPPVANMVPQRNIRVDFIPRTPDSWFSEPAPPG